MKYRDKRYIRSWHFLKTMHASFRNFPRIHSSLEPCETFPLIFSFWIKTTLAHFVQFSNLYWRHSSTKWAMISRTIMKWELTIITVRFPAKLHSPLHASLAKQKLNVALTVDSDIHMSFSIFWCDILRCGCAADIRRWVISCYFLNFQFWWSCRQASACWQLIWAGGDYNSVSSVEQF